MIHDFKASLVNTLVRLQERVVLPRPVDLGRDLALLATASSVIALLILDFEDAYHTIPLLPQERRFAAADLGDSFVVYRCLGFGGKGYPLVYCRVASFAARCTAAMLANLQARFQLYMDDPALSVAGDRASILATIDAVIVLWLVLDSRVAWKKAALVFLGGETSGLVPRRPSPGHTWGVSSWDIGGLAAARGGCAGSPL